MRRIFRDPASGKIIEDVSGKKTKKEVLKLFYVKTISGIEQIDCNNGDSYRVIDNKLKKIIASTLIFEKQDRETIKENKLIIIRERLNLKFGFTTTDIEDLKAVL